MSDSQRECDRRQKLFDLFRQVKSTGGTLIIGGDFFDFWFDYKHVIPQDYTDLLEALTQLHHAGIEIHYVAGNHDYWDFGYFQRQFGARFYTGDMVFDHRGKKIILTHGDGILSDDVGYRFMKKVIRSRICIFLFRNFHPDWGCALAEKVSNTSNQYNSDHTLNAQCHAELLSYARSKWRAGYDTILMGHYHQTGMITEKDKHFIHLGDWLSHFTVTTFDGDEWKQTSW